MMNVSLPLPNEGYFIARPDTVGTTNEELKRACAGQLPGTRATEIARCAGYAMEALKLVTAEGRC